MSGRVRDCPCGDRTCPCQDGDSCHYEWSGDSPPWLPPGRRVARTAEEVLDDFLTYGDAWTLQRTLRGK